MLHVYITVNISSRVFGVLQKAEQIISTLTFTEPSQLISLKKVVVPLQHGCYLPS